MSKYELELTDLMDATYGAGAWSERSGAWSGTNIAPAIARGVTQLRADTSTRRGIIKLGSASWTLSTGACDLSGITLQGVSSQATQVVYANAGGVALPWTGAQGLTGGGLQGCGLLLESGMGDTNAIGILLQGDANLQADETCWEEVYLTAVGGTSWWWDGVHLDGSARQPPKAKGCRVTKMEQVKIFQCRNIGLYAAGAVELLLESVGCYTGKGPYGNSVLISGSDHVHGILVNAGVIVGGSTDVKINDVTYA